MTTLKNLTKFIKKINFKKTYSFFPPTKDNITTIGVHSIDYDGLAGPPNITPNKVNTMLAPFITYLKQLKAKYGYDWVYLFCGSNRQSIPLDCINAIYNENNLAFFVWKALVHALGNKDTIYDPLLLSDITANQPPGFTLCRMREIISEYKLDLSGSCVPGEVLDKLLKGDHPTFHNSGDKINIIYAQLHRIALLHPDAKIYFNFYDDLKEKVLYPLENFYKKYPTLIPSNIVLNLYHYSTQRDESNHNNEDVPDRLCSINGTGIIDSNYYQEIQGWGAIAEEKEGNVKEFNMGNYITPELTHTRANQRTPNKNANSV